MMASDIGSLEPLKDLVLARSDGDTVCFKDTVALAYRAVASAPARLAFALASSRRLPPMYCALAVGLVFPGVSLQPRVHVRADRNQELVALLMSCLALSRELANGFS